MELTEKPPEARRNKFAAALICGAPLFAAAMTLGVALVDIFLLPSVNLPDLGADWIVPINAGLAFAGAATGGLCLRATTGARIGFALLAGAFGIAAYVALMSIADLLVPGF